MEECMSSAAGKRATGEVPLRYTDIGGGPNGMTVIYVLNEDNKKERPEQLKKLFKARHAL